jgi:hypothetical protein
LKHSASFVLAVALAAVAVAGALFVALATGGAPAPASGQKTFDAPGCLPPSYSGPGHVPHRLLGRNCPTPTPVIVASFDRGGRRVILDGSLSFDPMGGKVVGWSWALGPGPQREGKRIVVADWAPGPHVVILHATDDSGLVGTRAEEIVVP